MRVRELRQAWRPGREHLLVYVLVLIALSLLGCAAGKSAATSTDNAVETGQRLYATNCTVCHGEQGDKVAGAPLNSKAFLDSRGNALLVHTIAEGKGIMPAWGEATGGPLSWNEIDALVAYLNSVAGRSGSTLLSSSGRNVYDQQCSRCHGERGDRIPVAPLAAKPFLDARTDDQLIRVISDGKGLMPAFRTGSAAPLTEEQVQAVVTYIRYNASAAIGEELRRGRQLYASNCLPCHGEQGDQVPNVALASANHLRRLGDGGVTSTIADGRGAMPAFVSSKGGTFEVSELAAVLAYLKSWAGLPVGSAVNTGESPVAAKELYTRSCVGCHGESGEKVTGVSLKSHAYLDGRSDAALARQIGQGNAHGMPAWGQTTGGPLSEQEIGNLLGYLRSSARAVPIAVAPVPESDLSAPQGDLTARGKQLFRNSCVACHGESRDKVSNANLADPNWLQSRGDDLLHRAITFGKGSMPSWGRERGGPLTDSDTTAIVSFLKAAADGLVSTADATSNSTQDISLSTEATAGQRIFTKNCVACHGPRRDSIPAAKLANAQWLAERGDSSLAQTIAGGRAGMPSMSQEKDGPLTQTDIAAVVAYLKEMADATNSR